MSSFLVAIIFLSCTHYVTKEYFTNGNIKSKLSYNKDSVLDGTCRYYSLEENGYKELSYHKGELILYKEFFETGVLSFEAQIKGDVKDGISKEYYENEKLMIMEKYSLGKLIYYYEYDTTGNVIYWYMPIEKNSIPVFREEYVNIKNVLDSGFYVQAEVPSISPYQLIPFAIQGKGKAIDRSKALWIISPKVNRDSLIRVGIRVIRNDTVSTIIGWKELRLSDIK